MRKNIYTIFFRFLTYRNLYILNMVKDVDITSFEPEHQEFTDIKIPIRGD